MKHCQTVRRAQLARAAAYTLAIAATVHPLGNSAWAQVAAAPAPDRTEFMNRVDVLQGLDAVSDIASMYGVRDQGDRGKGHDGVTEVEFQDACWKSVLMRLKVEPVVGRAHVDSCLNGAVSVVDPHARFKRLNTSQPGLGPAGIGIELKHTGDKQFVMVDVYPGSPAERGGIVAGERIVSVDGQELRGLSMDEAIALLRGQEQTPVRLYVASAESGQQEAMMRDVDLIRHKLSFPLTFLVPLKDAWYVQMRDFGDGARDQFPTREFLLQAKALEEGGSRPTTVVLDLRGNAGGVADNIMQFATLFVNREAAGMLVFEPGRAWSNSPPYAFQEDFKILEKAFVVVLVDEDTGSGAEWLADTLRRHAGALIVGSKTAGGLQVRKAHANFGEFRDTRFEIPTGQLFAQGGTLLQGQGLAPDVVLDEPRLKRRRLGKPPEWLQDWLLSEMPVARKRQSDKAQALQPAIWSGTSAVDQHTWCVGANVMSVPASLRDWTVSSALMNVRTSTNRISVSSKFEKDPYEEPQVKWANEVVYLEAKLAKLRKAPKTHATEIHWTQESLERARKAQANASSWPIGTTGMRLHMDEGEHWMRWTNGSVAHELRIDTGTDKAPSTHRLLALYGELASHLTMGDAPPPGSMEGVCLAGSFLSLPEPVLQLDWTSRWTSRADAVRAQAFNTIELDGWYERPQSAAFAARVDQGSSDEDAAWYGDTQMARFLKDADIWLLDGDSQCRAKSWPELTRSTVAGFDVMARRTMSARGESQSCLVRRVVPRDQIRGLAWRMGAKWLVAKSASLGEAESGWQQVLDNMKVLPAFSVRP